MPGHSRTAAAFNRAADTIQWSLSLRRRAREKFRKEYREARPFAGKAGEAIVGPPSPSSHLSPLRSETDGFLGDADEGAGLGNPVTPSAVMRVLPLVLGAAHRLAGTVHACSKTLPLPTTDNQL